MFLWLIAFFLAAWQAAATPTFEDEPPDINLVSQRYEFEVTDWVVPGAEPLEIKRIYSSGGSRRRHCGWDFWPAAVYDFSQERTPNYYDSILARADTDFPKQAWIELAEPSGKIATYKRTSSNLTLFTPPRSAQEVKAYCYFVHQGDEDALSGQTSVRNNRLYIEADSHNMTVFEANGNVRYYKHKDHLYRLQFEERPNGHLIHYKYDDENRLISVKSTDRSGFVAYASLECSYPTSTEMHINTSDGKHLAYTFDRFTWFLGDSYWPKSRLALQEVRLENTLLDTYEYKKTNYKSGCFLSARKTADGRHWQIEHYLEDIETTPEGKTIDMLGDKDPRRWRVKQVLVPNSQNSAKWIPLYQCKVNGTKPSLFFNIESTEICNAAGAKTVLYFDETLFISSQEDYAHNKLIAKTVYTRDESHRLIMKELFDAFGHLQTLRSFCYDSANNVVQERAEANFSGNGFEPCEKRYEYSPAHLVTRVDEPNGVETHITYKANTNLVTSRALHVNGRPFKRQQFAYDNDNLLIEMIEDDGETPTQKTYKRITPRSAFPALGSPEWVEEGFFDLNTGKRVPLKKNRFHYNSASKIVKEETYDRDGALRFTLNFEYDPLGHLIRKTDPFGNEFKYSYDERGRLIEEQEPGAAKKRYLYGWHGKLGVFQEMTENPTTISYSFFPEQRKIYIQTSSGIIKELAFNGAGHLLHESKASQFQYDLFGHLACETKADGTTTTYDNTIHGKRAKITYPDGSSSSHRYDLNGNLCKSTLEDGTRILFDNDPLGRVVRKRIYSNHDTLLSEESWDYNAYHLLRHIDPTGNIRTYNYDGAGRKHLETLSSSQGISKIAYTYDALGFISSSELKLHAGDSLKTIFVNDLLGRSIEERQEDKTGTLLRKTNTTYDPANNRCRIERLTAAGPAIDTTTFDLKKRPLKHIDPLGRIEFFNYEDGKGTRVKHTGFDGLVTEEHYDPQGLLLEKTVGKERRERFEYDILKRKIRQAINDTYAVSWDYDKLGRVATLREQGSSSLEKTTCYAYDARGRLIQLTRPSGKQLFYTYDSLDRLLRLSSSDGTVDYRYTYSTLDQPTSVQDIVHGTEVRRTYTSLGEISSEETPAGRLNKHYDPAGRCTRLTLPDASCIDYEYTPAHLRTICRKRADGHALYTHTAIAWDTDGTTLKESMIGNLGELIHKSDLLARPQSVHSNYFTEEVEQRDRAARPTASRSNLFGLQSFAYDSHGNLAAEKSAALTHEYTYDPLENRISQDLTPWNVDRLNRLHTTNTDTCDYDLDGQLISCHQGSEEWRFAYDALGRMVEVTNNGTLLARYAYDAWHRRLTKQLTQNLTLNFLYDGQKEIGCRDASGHIVELRVLNMDPRPQAVAIELNGRPLAPLHDLRGNLTALVAQDGKLEATYSYGAFGECKASGSLKNPWRFSGQRVDDETSLVFFGRRYYQPRWGRWITPDPADFIDGLNLYTYVHNDPVNRYDPNGLQATIGNYTIDVQIHFITPNLSCSIGSNSFSSTLGRGLLYVAGSAIECIARHALFEIPLVKNGIILLGALLRLDHPLVDLDLKRSVLLRGKLPIRSNRAICFFSGILNDADDATASLRRLADMTQTKSFIIWTPSRGFVSDIVESAALYLGFATQALRQAEVHLKNVLRNELSDADRLQLASHSMGTLIAAALLERLNLNERAQIAEAAFFASPKLVPAIPGVATRNFISNNDFIPKLDLFGWLKKHFGLENYNITELNSPSLVNHSMWGDIYEHALRRHYHGPYPAHPSTS